MNLQTVNELLAKQDGNHSCFYPILKDRMDVYDETEVAFAEEFLFFEERYLTIKKHMIEHEVNQNIVDIGCQLGFQSELFLDSPSYLGIDCFKPSHFMNSEKENINYLVGLFPNTDIDLTGKTVISSMSLGYFDGMINKDQELARNLLVNALMDASTIYIASQKSFVDKLSPHFESTTLLSETIGDFDLYVLQKKKS